MHTQEIMEDIAKYTNSESLVQIRKPSFRPLVLRLRIDSPKATFVTSRPELAETLEPTKHHQWRSGRLDASPFLPSPPRQLRG